MCSFPDPCFSSIKECSSLVLLTTVLCRSLPFLCSMCVAYILEYVTDGSGVTRREFSLYSKSTSSTSIDVLAIRPTSNECAVPFASSRCVVSYAAFSSSFFIIRSRCLFSVISGYFSRVDSSVGQDGA